MIAQLSQWSTWNPETGFPGYSKSSLDYNAHRRYANNVWVYLLNDLRTHLCHHL